MIKKQIVQAIQNLLLEHSYVTIPQLGGFVSKYQSATIVLEKNLILPPSKKISFNAELKNDDGLLVKFLAEQEGIELEKVQKNIQHFVKEVFIQLDDGKKVVFDKIGTLSFNKHLNLEFETEKQKNYNPHSYGMVGVECKALTENEIIEKKNNLIFTRKNLMRAAVIIPFLVVGTILSVYLNHIGLLSKAQQQIASVLPFSVDTKGTQKLTEDKNPISKAIDFKTNKKNALAYAEPTKDQTEEVKVTNKETPKVISENSLKNPIKELKVSLEDTKETVEEIEKPNINKKELLKFQLIAGSFKSEANAKRLSKKIQKLNYQPIVIKQGNRYRVITSSFSKKSDAVKAKEDLKKQNVSTWVNTLK